MFDENAPLVVYKIADFVSQPRGVSACNIIKEMRAESPVAFSL